MDLEQECVTFPLVRSCPAKGVICLLRPFMSESTAEVKSRVVVSGVGVVMDVGPDTEASNLGDSEPSQPRTTSRRTPANMTAMTLARAAADGNRCAGGTNNRSVNDLSWSLRRLHLAGHYERRTTPGTHDARSRPTPSRKKRLQGNENLSQPS